MAYYQVSQPYINVQIADTPLTWMPARGNPINFTVYYRQRGAIDLDPNVFGVGANWSCSFNAFMIDMGASSPGLLKYHKNGQGWTLGTDGVGTFLGGEIPSNLGGGVYQIAYPDGSTDIFSKAYTNVSGDVCYFLTSQKDPLGNTTTYSYVNTSAYVQLLSVTDADGGTYTLYYENASFPLQITKVVSPDTRTNLLQYDTDGYLTNSIDPVGLESQMVYDTGTRRSWITNLITAYGTNTFEYGGVDAERSTIDTSGNVINRYVEVTLPNGGKELYLYRADCSAILSSTYSPVPNTDVPNTFDNVAQDQLNSFYWGPLQHTFISNALPNLSSNDYTFANMKHWLIGDSGVSSAVSLERLPTPDLINSGQLVWYDYADKVLGNNHVGDIAIPSIVARVLPRGGTNYQAYTRNAFGTPTQQIETYTKTDGTTGLRTNTYIFSVDNVDFIEHVGPNGEQVVSNYFNTYHQPLASYDALNQATLYTYNVNHQLIKTARPSGLTTTNIYFASGASVNRLDKTIDLEINRTNSYTYTGCVVYSHTDERGLKTTNYWDNVLRLVGVAYPDGSTTSNRYTALDVTASKDRLNQWTYASFNGIRQKVAETNENNVVTRYGYCTCGALMTVTNGFGSSVQQITSFGYDYQGNQTYVYLPDDTVMNSFDSLKRITNTTSSLGNRQMVYNNQGLPSGTTNGMGLQKWTVFDIEDRPLWVTEATGVTVTNTYDDLNRLQTKTYPDAGAEKFGYSARGMIAYTNQIGQITRWGFDEAMRKLAETNANNEIIRFTNNAAGDLISLTDGKLHTTKWNYDEYGRLTNKLDQAGVEILRYKYDADNRLTNRWSAAKGNTYYTYDLVGNLTNIAYPSSTDVRFTFDALNRVSTMVDAVGTTVYTYTAGGQLLKEDGPFTSDNVTNVYNGRLRTGLGLQQPTGNWTNGFYYDLAGQLTNVTSQTGSFTYLLGGTAPASPLIKKLSFPNTAYITNTYDRVARLTGTYLKNNVNSALDSYVYHYDLANERTDLTRLDTSTVAFSYDNIGQLTVADSSVNSEDRGYFYDAAWNLNWLTNNGSASQFIVDNKNELTNAPASNPISYDVNGNMTAYSSGHLNVYTYDDENRLIDFQDLLLGNETVFVYDGLGRLRIRQEYVAPPQRPVGIEGPIGAGTLSSETHYIYDGKRVIQERDGSNTPLVSYTRGRDLSGSLEGAGGIGGLLARSTGSSGTWTTHNTYFADGNGNVTYMLNSSQAMVASYRYDPFGNSISSIGTLASANVYRFSSKEYHAVSGMYYYLYRFYDPNLQRWVNRDPIEEAGGINLYTFVNNSFNKIDPDGNKPIEDLSFPPGYWPPTCPRVKPQDCYTVWNCKLSPGGAISSPLPGGKNTCLYDCKFSNDNPSGCSGNTPGVTSYAIEAKSSKPCPLKAVVSEGKKGEFRIL
jgi:RHS repeat-associated protein